MTKKEKEQTIKDLLWFANNQYLNYIDKKERDKIIIKLNRILQKTEPLTITFIWDIIKYYIDIAKDLTEERNNLRDKLRIVDPNSLQNMFMYDRNAIIKCTENFDLIEELLFSRNHLLKQNYNLDTEEKFIRWIYDNLNLTEETLKYETLKKRYNRFKKRIKSKDTLSLKKK